MKKSNEKLENVANNVGVAAHSNPQINKTTKFDCRGGRLCPPANKQNGITLIALIITIIVMLILVGVTINVALNGGLFKKAETATKQTEEQAILEEMLSMMEITDDGKFNVDTIIGKMREKYDVEYDATNANATITGKLGTYNYIVSATEIKIKGDSEEDLAYLKSYFVGNDLVSLLADPSEFTFTDARITVDFENFDGSPELVDGYMYMPVKFNNSIYNLKIEITDESSLVVRDVIKIGESIEDPIEEANFNTFTVGDLLENATYDSGNSASSKGAWVLPVSKFNEIIGYDITETGNFIFKNSDIPGTDDVDGKNGFIFFSSINGPEVGSLHVLVLVGIELSYNIPEDTWMEAAPWVNTNGENTGTAYAFSSMINGNNVYVAPGADSNNVYKSLSEIPEELLNTQLTINNTQALTKLFIKYK